MCGAQTSAAECVGGGGGVHGAGKLASALSNGVVKCKEGGSGRVCCIGSGISGGSSSEGGSDSGGI